MSWMDYLLAALVGCAGMLGLSELAGDLVALNREAYEITLATLILAEAMALSRIGTLGGVPLSQWCMPLPDHLRYDHCAAMSEWLSALNQSQLQATADGRVALRWISSTGDYLELIQPLWAP
jgi:hypothetical protein